jgi:hypothetical protein
MVENLPSKHEALSSNRVPPKSKTKDLRKRVTKEIGREFLMQ